MTSAAVVALTMLAMVSLATLILVLGVMRRMAPALERAERLLAADPMSPDSGLQVGSSVPDFSVFDPVGRELQKSELLQGDATAFLFIADGCPSCGELATQLQHERWQSPHRLVVITDQRAGWAASDDRIRLTHQVGHTASQAFRQTSLPQAFVVDRDSIVVGRVFPRSMHEVSHLVHAVLRPSGGLHVVSSQSHHESGDSLAH